MQVDPLSGAELKPPETQRLKQECGKPLSNVAFKFNLRRFPKGRCYNGVNCYFSHGDEPTKVGPCRLTLSNPS